MSKITKTIAALGVVAGLGVAALPLASYAATDSLETPITVTASLVDAISIESSADSINTMSLTAGGPVVSSNQLDITVITNATNGYNVTIEDGDENIALVGTGSNDETIAAGNPSQGTSAWGYKFGEALEEIDSFTAITTEPVQVATKDAKTNDTGDVYKLGFGASAAASLTPDTYTGSVTLTATTK